MKLTLTQRAAQKNARELGMVDRLIWRTEAAIETEALVEFSSREAKDLVLKLLKRRERELMRRLPF